MKKIKLLYSSADSIDFADVNIPVKYRLYESSISGSNRVQYKEILSKEIDKHNEIILKSLINNDIYDYILNGLISVPEIVVSVEKHQIVAPGRPTAGFRQNTVVEVVLEEWEGKPTVKLSLVGEIPALGTLLSKIS